MQGGFSMSDHLYSLFGLIIHAYVHLRHFAHASVWTDLSFSVLSAELHSFQRCCSFDGEKKEGEGEGWSSDFYQGHAAAHLLSSPLASDWGSHSDFTKYDRQKKKKKKTPWLC